jgi:hypothetical protein
MSWVVIGCELTLGALGLSPRVIDVLDRDASTEQLARYVDLPAI